MCLILILNLFFIILASLIFMINMIISKKMIQMRNSMSSFECGFDPLSHLRLPFSTHFFLISLIFLIFDVEISLILLVTKSFSFKLFINKLFMFIMIILLIGLYYEWKEGSLNWLM